MAELVECAALEMRYTRKGIRGSNPLVSAHRALIVQWIERELPELKVGVRFPLGAQKKHRPAAGVFVYQFN